MADLYAHSHARHSSETSAPACVTWLWSSESGNPTIASYTQFSCGHMDMKGPQQLLPESPTSSVSITSVIIVTHTLTDPPTMASTPTMIFTGSVMADDSGNSEAKIPVILGGTFGGLSLLLLAISGFCFWKRRRMSKVNAEDEHRKIQEPKPASVKEADGQSHTGRSELECHSRFSDAETMRASSTGTVADEGPGQEMGRSPGAMASICELEGGQY